MAVLADREACVGSGLCSMYAPAAFSQDETTKVVVQAEEVDRDPEAAATAVDACPTGALRIVVKGSLSHGQ